MDKQQLNDLSSLMDNECSAEQSKKLLEELCHDTRLQQCWRQYHLIRSVLRNERSSYLYDTDAACAALAIARREQTGISPNQQRGLVEILREAVACAVQSMRQAPVWFGGGAVAASLAAVAFFANPPYGEYPGVSTNIAQDSRNAELIPDVSVDRTRWRSDITLSAYQQDLLSTMMLSHTDFAVDDRLNHLQLVAYDRSIN